MTHTAIINICQTFTESTSDTNNRIGRSAYLIMNKVDILLSNNVDVFLNERL